MMLELETIKKTASPDRFAFSFQYCVNFRKHSDVGNYYLKEFFHFFCNFPTFSFVPLMPKLKELKLKFSQFFHEIYGLEIPYI